MTKRLVVLFLLCTLSAYVEAQDFKYTANNSTITITDFTGTNTTLNIPSIISGLPVTSIGPEGFISFRDRLRAVVIPSITGDAHNTCGLTNITIPNSVTNIGLRAFVSCANLEEFTVDPLNSFYASVNGVLFNKRQTILIKYPARKSGSSFTIPNGVTDIEPKAFDSCTYLTSVTIPNSVTNMPYALDGCGNLEGITVDPLNSFYASVNGILFNKRQTILIKYPARKSDSSYTIPNSVITINNRAFFGCNNLTSVTIGNAVTSTGGLAFYSCTNLTNVTIGNSLILFGMSTFASCSSLRNVSIPNSVSLIAQGAFSHCTSLANVIIPDSVTNITACAFDSCSSLTNVTIGRSVTTIGDLAFAHCTNLTGVYFKGSVPRLDTSGFPDLTGAYGRRTESSAFTNASNATIYYLPGTKGWGPTFGGRPTAVWRPWSVSKGLKGFVQ